MWCLTVLALFIQGCSSTKNGTEDGSIGESELVTSSPDKSLSVEFGLTDGEIAFYTVSKNDTLVLEQSRLGIMREDADFSQGLKLASVSEVEPVQDKYEILTAKRRVNTYNANRRTYHLANAAGEKMDIIFQVSNDGVAFRYYFPGNSSEVKKISDELTSFNFKADAKGWLQPMSDAKTGWSRTNPSYEEHYKKGIPVGTPSPFEAGWVYPALFQTGNHWVLITESAPEGTYSGTRLHQESPAGEYTIDFPQETEKMPGGVLNPESALPWYTPWRILAVGSLKTFTESTLGTDLATPAVSMDQDFIKPGQASWSWVLLKDDSTTFEVQKRFIDYAADMNWEYTLIDATWDTMIGYNKIKELADYAKTKNVGLLLWYNSNGTWNDAPQTPRHQMLMHESRMKEFKRISDMGIKGVKVDFFGGDGQSVMQYYSDILKDAAANNLLVNFHGSTLPRGLQRTYPNLMTSEAIKGYEFITFDQGNADEAPSHGAMLPFTRNVFDPMDFTPLSLHIIPNIERRTTVGHELALSVLFMSGIQHYAETDQGMKHVPSYVKDFLREVPAVWDDTRFVDGFPGKLAVIARKAGDRWYVAGINGENTAKSINIDLSFLGDKQGTLITDDSGKGAFRNAAVDLGNSRTQKIELKPNGGFVMVF
ncbi:glycoside hydrolase family 97 protein [Pontibacter rugosus]